MTTRTLYGSELGSLYMCHVVRLGVLVEFITVGAGVS